MSTRLDMGDDIRRALREAWERVRPILAADPEELARRLARRRSLVAPPRDWCLVIRASDRRIDRLGQRSAIAEEQRRRWPGGAGREAHAVTLGGQAIRCLTAHERIEWGMPVQGVAEMVGRHPGSLAAARALGVFRQDHVPGTGGRGRVAILRADRRLNPSRALMALPDPMWAGTGDFVHSHVSDAESATLTRVPMFRPSSSVYRRINPPHPEFDVPRTSDYRPRPKRYRVPAPQPDHVWYKWMRGQNIYLGDNPKYWRKGPEDVGIPPGDPRRAKDDAEWARAAAKKKAQARRAHQRWRAKHARATGSLLFCGWSWACPSCGRLCRMIYRPIPRPTHLIAPLPRLAEAVEIPRGPVQGFACVRCHRVRHFSRLSRSGWNQVVAYLSGGMLYGYEVEKPKWWTRERKRPFVPKPNSAPSARRAQVLAGLLAGLSYKQIAAGLGIGYATVNEHTKTIYRQHGVHSRAELCRKEGRVAEAGEGGGEIRSSRFE